MQRETVLILDFGSQFNQLIARRVRELGVYCELIPFSTPIEKIKAYEPKGIIFSGGPKSVYEEDSPRPDDGIYSLGVPIFGICYGCQLIAQRFGGQVFRGESEYGKCTLNRRDGKTVLFDGLPQESICWMSHSDYVRDLPDDFRVTASTDNVPNVGFEDDKRKIYCVQFHPEVAHTEKGKDIISNFLFKACRLKGDWNMANFAAEQIELLREKIGDKKVLCALSGGVDSAVAATLIHRACPNLICVFVDHGLLRKNEAEEVVRVFAGEQKMNLIKVDAQDEFLDALKGACEPEKKRKIIGSHFIKVFEREAKKIGKVDFLVQGTIYPDRIESGLNGSATIKSHHNVGGLPSVVDFKEIIEPLRDLFKDEVRALGFTLGLPESIVMRQPFPGPGLGIRIMGEVTREKLEILREADCIYREEIAKAGLDKSVWQYFAVLTSTQTVGVMGDYRTYDYTLALRGVTSVDGMTADWARIPYEVLDIVSRRIVNEVKSVNRVVYDITSKPPATIEWE